MKRAYAGGRKQVMAFINMKIVLLDLFVTDCSHRFFFMACVFFVYGCFSCMDVFCVRLKWRSDVKAGTKSLKENCNSSFYPGSIYFFNVAVKEKWMRSPRIS